MSKNDWIELTTARVEGSDEERLTNEMPRDQGPVEVRLKDGSTHHAIYEFYGPEEWWFVLVDDYGLPNGLPKYDGVVAWRYLETSHAK